MFSNIARHLSPAVIRVGGVTCDWVYYAGFDMAVSTGRPLVPMKNVTSRPSEFNNHVSNQLGYWPTSESNLTLGNFELLLNFMSASNFSLMFDLNELHGRDCQLPSPHCFDKTNPYCNAWCSGQWDMSNVRTFLLYIHDKGLVGGSSP